MSVGATLAKVARKQHIKHTINIYTSRVASIEVRSWRSQAWAGGALAAPGNVVKCFFYISIYSKTLSRLIIYELFSQVFVGFWELRPHPPTPLSDFRPLEKNPAGSRGYVYVYTCDVARVQEYFGQV